MADKPDDKKDEQKKDDTKAKVSDDLRKDEEQKAEDVRKQEKPDAPLSVVQRAGAGVNVVPGEPSSGAAPKGLSEMPGDPSAHMQIPVGHRQEMEADRVNNPGAQPGQIDLRHLEHVQNERMAKVEHVVTLLIEVINELGPWASDIWHSTKARTKLMRAREHMLPHMKETPDQYSPNRTSARQPIDLAPEFDNRARMPGDTGPHAENFPHPTPMSRTDDTAP